MSRPIVVCDKRLRSYILNAALTKVGVAHPIGKPCLARGFLSFQSAVREIEKAPPVSAGGQVSEETLKYASRRGQRSPRLAVPRRGLRGLLPALACEYCPARSLPCQCGRASRTTTASPTSPRTAFSDISRTACRMSRRQYLKPSTSLRRTVC